MNFCFCVFPRPPDDQFITIAAVAGVSVILYKTNLFSKNDVYQ